MTFLRSSSSSSLSKPDRFLSISLSLSLSHTHTHTHTHTYSHTHAMRPNRLSKEENCQPLAYHHHHHHHHHVVPLARISLSLSRHFSQSFIASGRSSGLHPVSSHSFCMYVRAGRPAFTRPYVGVHRSSSLMSSFLLL